MRFEQISTAQGLSQVSVNAILQDSEGFIWFATQDGLNRYDGYEFKIYRQEPGNPNSLLNNWVHTLFEDNQGTLWVGTDGGLLMFNRQQDNFVRYTHDSQNPHSIGSNVVHSIAQDSSGDLWLGAYRGGLNRFNRESGQFTRYLNAPNDKTSIADDTVFSVLVDADNNVWAGLSRGGLARFDRENNHFTHYTHDPDDKTSLSNNRVYRLYQDKQQRLWVGTRGGGLNQFHYKDESFSHYWPDITQRGNANANIIESIFQDSQDNLWVGTSKKGLTRLETTTGEFTFIYRNNNDSQAFHGEQVQSIGEDASGMLWFGTLSHGINKHNPATRHFGHYNHQPGNANSLKNNHVWALYADVSGDIWVGSQNGGLSRIHNHQFTHFSHQANVAGSLSSNNIYRIVQDHQGVLWLGTDNAGISRFDPVSQTFSHMRHDPDNPNSISANNRMTSMIEDRDHYLWIGSIDGLNRLDPDRKQFTRFMYSPDNLLGIGGKAIDSLLEDHNGDIWVSLYRNGVDLFDKSSGTFSHYRHDPNNSNSLSSNSVNSIYQTADGIMWFGTRTGLDKFDSKTNTFSHYRTKQGLSNDTVLDMAADEQGFLWLTTNHGLNRFDPRSETFNVYLRGDGIQDNEFSAGAFHISPSGQVLVGGVNGFNVFDPKVLHDNSIAPTIVFTDFLLNNQSVQISTPSQLTPLGNDINHIDSLVLNYTDRIFGFGFSALHYASPKQNQYSYRLKGFDDQWMYTDAQHRRATYTNMDAGDYVFVVKGSNNDNLFSDEPRQIKVTILPAPWRTWWAYSLYGVIIFTLLFVVLFLRAKKLAAERQAAMAIEASEHQLSLALWGSGDQLWDWDKTRGSIQRKNTLSHFTFKPQEGLMTLAQMSEKLHPDDQDKFHQALAAHCDHGKEHFECAYRLKDKTGQWRWVLDRGKIVDKTAQGEISRFTGTLQDIHSMRMAKQQLRELNDTLEQKVADRTQALQDSIDKLTAAQQQLVEAEKMASLGNLVAGVAHEVNTPLGICITMVSLHIEKLNQLTTQLSAGSLSRQLLQSYVEQTAESQALVDSNLHRAAQLIQSFKKVAVEQSADGDELIHFHQYLKDIIRSVAPRANHHQVTITLITDEDWQVQTCPGAWWQLLSNLIENSLLHGFADNTTGNITDSTGGDISIAAVLVEDRLKLVYQDNGKGMDAQQLENIYEPFYTTTRHQGSTGLGMHIVYNLVVQKLGGTIDCQSEPDKGVMFTLEMGIEQT